MYGEMGSMQPTTLCLWPAHMDTRIRVPEAEGEGGRGGRVEVMIGHQHTANKESMQHAAHRADAVPNRTEASLQAKGLRETGHVVR